MLLQSCCVLRTSYHSAATLLCAERSTQQSTTASPTMSAMAPAAIAPPMTAISFMLLKIHAAGGELSAVASSIPAVKALHVACATLFFACCREAMCAHAMQRMSHGVSVTGLVPLRISAPQLLPLAATLLTCFHSHLRSIIFVLVDAFAGSSCCLGGCSARVSSAATLHKL